MKTIFFSSIKGGTGKSSLCILTANCTASSGARVLVIDLDLQNSLSSYYLDEPDLADRRNISRALHDENLKENIVRTNYMGVDLLASAFDLVKLRSLGDRTLARLLPALNDAYDFCFIDTAPTYDNLVLNALVASDLILTPVAFSQFDYKAALFYRDQLTRDTDQIDKWKILFNFYRPSRSDNPSNLRNQYESLFKSSFSDILLPITVPESPLVRRSIDTKEPITSAATKVALHAAIASLTESFGVAAKVGRF